MDTHTKREKASSVEQRVHGYLKEKYAYLPDEERYFYHSDLRDECEDALEDEVITQDEYDLVEAVSGERWRLPKNN